VQPRHFERATIRSLLLTIGLFSGLLTTGCDLNSELAKRFREAYAPGLIAGLSSAVASPGSAEAGLRDALAALINGLGALINVQGPTSSSTSGS
jgi:hypothetical protein